MMKEMSLKKIKKPIIQRIKGEMGNYMSILFLDAHGQENL